jgi:hypothetical protein
MNEQDKVEGELIRHVRRAWNPNAENIVRIRSAVEGAVSQAGVSVTPSPWQEGVWVSLKRRALRKATHVCDHALAAAPKLMAVVAVTSIAAGAAYRAGEHEGREAARHQAAATRATVIRAAPTRAAPTPAPLHTPPVVPPVRAERPPKGVRASSAAALADGGRGEPGQEAEEILAEEVRVLRRVESALRSGNTLFALALLDALDQTVPDGKLMEERAAAYVRARCEREDQKAALERGQAFSKRYPESVYLPRVREACEPDAQSQDR